MVMQMQAKDWYCFQAICELSEVMWMLFTHQIVINIQDKKRGEKYACTIVS